MSPSHPTSMGRGMMKNLCANWEALFNKLTSAPLRSLWWRPRHRVRMQQMRRLDLILFVSIYPACSKCDRRHKFHGVKEKCPVASRGRAPKR